MILDPCTGTGNFIVNSIERMPGSALAEAYRNRLFAVAGRELARLHVEYESLAPYPLKETENRDVPYSQRVTKMKLSADKQSLIVNPSLTFTGIPPETFEYRLGSRSALDWVIDQYRVKGESDPNCEDDAGYIIRSVGQVVRVSVETVSIVNALPAFRVEGAPSDS